MGIHCPKCMIRTLWQCLQYNYTRQCRSRAHRIIKDIYHPNHKMLEAALRRTPPPLYRGYGHCEGYFFPWSHTLFHILIMLWIFLDYYYWIYWSLHCTLHRTATALHKGLHRFIHQIANIHSAISKPLLPLLCSWYNLFVGTGPL